MGLRDTGMSNRSTSIEWLGQRPDLGIYDTRLWNTEFRKYLINNKNHPGPHPDPNCVWN